MSIASTDEQLAAQDAIRSWARATDPIAMLRCGDDQFWRRLWRGIADLGLFVAGVPETAGGSGGTVLDAAAMLEECARHVVGGPLLTTTVAGLLVGRADAPIAKRFGPELADGQLPCALVLDAGLSGEAGARGLTVSGTATAIGGASGVSVLAAVHTGAGESVVLLPADALEWEPLAGLDRSVPLARVRCSAVAVDDERIVTAVTADQMRDLTAVLAAAEAAGIAGRCLETAVDYAKVRVQFGKPIGSFQAVKHMCAQMLCRTERARVVAWDAAAAAESGAQLPLAAALAAAVALDAAVDTAKDCIQVLGGIGFTWEHDAHLFLRRATALRQLLGGSSHWRRRVTELTHAGARRRVEVDLSAYAGPRAAIRAAVADIAAAPDRRVALADSGLLTPHWPAPHGRGAAPAEQLLVAAELAAAGIDVPDLVIGGWAVPTILAHGTPAQIERFAGPTLRGELRWCQLFSEPEAGSDLASLRTAATRVDGGWQLSGQKVWTSGAQFADWGICLARTDREAPKHRGITYFLVDMRSPGIRIRPLREITGEERFNEVFLENVFVPDGNVVGEIGGGWRLAHTTLANERVAMSGGSALGKAMEELVAATPVDDPVLADGLGALVADAVVMALLQLRSTLRQLDGSVGAESSVRKLLGVRHRQAVAEFALQAAGTAGALEGPRAHEFLLTRCLSIAGGTEQILLSVAGERILGLPRG